MQIYRRCKIPILIVLALLAASCASGGGEATPGSSAVVSGGPTADNSGEAPNAQLEVTVGIPFGLVQFAALSGIENNENIAGKADLSTISIANPDEIRSGFAGGDIDIAVVPTNVAANLFNRDVDVRVVGVIDAELLQVVGPVAAEWEDMEGQKVHIPFQGDVGDLLFREMVKDNNLDPDEDIEIVYGTSLPDMVAGFATGAITFGVLPEHFSSAAVAQAGSNGVDIVPLYSVQQGWAERTGGERLPQVALVVAGDLEESNPEFVDLIGDVVEENIRQVEADPESRIVLLAEATELPEPLVAGVVAKLELDYRGSSEAEEDLLLFFAEMLEISPESLGGSVPEQKFVTG